MICSVSILLTLATASPQGPAPVGDLLGLVRTESGRVVSGAEVRFVPDTIPALRWLPPEPAPSTEGMSDDRGRFRFPVPAPNGALIVTHPAGLGAAVSRVSAGAPVPVVLRALGSIELDGGAPFRAVVQLLRPGLPAVRLPDATEPRTRLDLPAGRYLLLVDTNGAVSERAVTVRPGRIESLEPPQPGPILELGAVDRLELSRWPGVELRSRDGRIPTLAGPGVIRVTRQPAPDLAVVASGWIDEAGAARVAPAEGSLARVEVVDPDGDPIPGTSACTVVEEVSGPRIAGRSTADGDDLDVWVPSHPDGHAPPLRTVVVFTAPLHRPLLIPADAIPARVVLEPAQPAGLRLESADGDAVPFAAVILRSARDPLLDLWLRSDARGIVRLPHADVPGSAVEVRSDHHLPLLAALPAPDGPTLPVLRLDPGLTLVGNARLDGDRPAVGVELELRDPTGTLDVEPRTVITDSDGRFLFRGLPDGTYTLFGQTTFGGVTWSGKVRGVQPGRDRWDIVLRNEDPTPPGTRRNG